jgi:hypothetical protein
MPSITVVSGDVCIVALQENLRPLGELRISSICKTQVKLQCSVGVAMVKRKLWSVKKIVKQDLEERGGGESLLFQRLLCTYSGKKLQDLRIPNVLGNTFPVFR